MSEVFKEWLPAIIVIAFLLIVQEFSLLVAFILAMVIWSFCIGVLYGAGTEVRKRATLSEEPKG